MIRDRFANHRAAKATSHRRRSPGLRGRGPASPWLNQVERFFALRTGGALKRGVFHSVRERENAITKYLDATSADPKAFRWTKPAADILASLPRLCLRTIGAQA